MILAKDLLLLLKEVEKTCIFTQNWLDQLLLVTSYLVTIATDTKCAGGMNEQLLKTSGTDVLSSRKKLRKTLWEGGGGRASIPPLYLRGLTCLNYHIYNLRLTP